LAPSVPHGTRLVSVEIFFHSILTRHGSLAEGDIQSTADHLILTSLDQLLFHLKICAFFQYKLPWRGGPLYWASPLSIPWMRVPGKFTPGSLSKVKSLATQRGSVRCSIWYLEKWSTCQKVNSNTKWLKIWSWYCCQVDFLNRTARIRHLCKKTTVLDNHKCIINTGVETKIKIKFGPPDVCKQKAILVFEQLFVFFKCAVPLAVKKIIRLTLNFLGTPSG
jgi:hypothetical protein